MFGRAEDVFENVHEGNSAAEAVSGSPDGLGATAVPLHTSGPPAFHPGHPMHGKIEFLEPADASPQAALRTAGLTALAASVAFGFGLAVGGPWGGMSGVLLSGSAFNVYRSQKWWGSADASEKHEAVVSALFGAIGIAAGGYSAYRAYQSRGQ